MPTRCELISQAKLLGIYPAVNELGTHVAFFDQVGYRWSSPGKQWYRMEHSKGKHSKYTQCDYSKYTRCDWDNELIAYEDLELIIDYWLTHTKVNINLSMWLGTA